MRACVSRCSRPLYGVAPAASPGTAQSTAPHAEPTATRPSSKRIAGRWAPSTFLTERKISRLSWKRGAVITAVVALGTLVWPRFGAAEQAFWFQDTRPTISSLTTKTNQILPGSQAAARATRAARSPSRRSTATSPRASTAWDLCCPCQGWRIYAVTDGGGGGPQVSLYR